MIYTRIFATVESVALSRALLCHFQRDESATSEVKWDDFEVVGFSPIETLGVIPYGRHSGPTSVQLPVSEPKRCPGVTDDERQATRTAVPKLWVSARLGLPTVTRVSARLAAELGRSVSRAVAVQV